MVVVAAMAAAAMLPTLPKVGWAVEVGTRS